MNYEEGRRWEAGALLLWDSGRPEALVSIPGKALTGLGEVDQRALIKGLIECGFAHATRLDLAVDFRGVGLRLVDAIVEGVQAGELCGARRWKEVKTDGGVRGHTVYLGLRGKLGSGRFVRCYDKGLETGTCGPNEWHRYEVEFTKDSARKALFWLVQSQQVKDTGGLPVLPGWNGQRAQSDWNTAIVQAASGAVDFRAATGARLLRRRPRCQWWVEVWGDVEPRRIRCRRLRLPSLDGARRWIRKQVAPMAVAMARRTNQAVEVVLSDLMGEVEKIRGAFSAAVFEYEAEWSVRRAVPF